MQVE
jgi:hypothetical protein